MVKNYLEVSASQSSPSGTFLGIAKRLAIFLASALADLITYIVTSVQLALAFPTPTSYRVHTSWFANQMNVKGRKFIF
ncbi:hypothetical protein WA1_49840 [Scytonema hofmannii PCC 7110]|uniref:Uncharacterized protein n=1 Tax=Scytonema hofmannii PCC 7110 TaxID=128403 RepID=A0A139WQZ6_9CYAN|nr:hypothetical protein WA1_49840 [Scytonema hofmannii PCC 7110]